MELQRTVPEAVLGNHSLLASLLSIHLSIALSFHKGSMMDLYMASIRNGLTAFTQPFPEVTFYSNDRHLNCKGPL